MKFKAHAPELRFGGTEVLALVAERGVDHEARQRLAEQKLRHQAEAELRQLTLAAGSPEPGAKSH